MEKPWKVIAAFLGVFVAGAVFGGLFSIRSAGKRITPPPQHPVPIQPSEHPRKVAGPPTPGGGDFIPMAPRANQITPQLMRQFTKTLKLTPEQHKAIMPIVGRAGEDFQRLREEDMRRRQEDNRRKQENLEDVARVNERMYVDVSNVLTPPQRERLQKQRQDIENKVQADRLKREEANAELAAARAALKAEKAAQTEKAALPEKATPMAKPE
ncbi:MAG: hypothetical protein V4773_30615 [Verrucomicrobiota bacterium]